MGKQPKGQRVADAAPEPAPRMARKERASYEGCTPSSVAMQESIKTSGTKVCIMFEGRDSAGKGGTIKAITGRLSPRVFRVVALPSLTERERSSEVLPPATQQTVADALETDAEVITNTQLEAQLAGQLEAIQDEIIRINSDARPRALQVALLVPTLAALLGLLVSFRMMRLPDPAPSESTEGMAFG